MDPLEQICHKIWTKAIVTNCQVSGHHPHWNFVPLQ